MKENILDEIISVTRLKLATLTVSDRQRQRSRAREGAQIAESFRLSKALKGINRVNIIAEFKRASPSKGIINDQVDVAAMARSYERNGACAISVLTEGEYFKGSIDDLKTVRSTVDIPILRKDFTVDEYQIHEAAAEGASAILLIVAALSIEELTEFQGLAHNLGLDALVEVHTSEELQIASRIGAKLVGVNNRDLRTFNVSLDTSRNLIKVRPGGALMIAESGISTRSEIDELSSMGFNGFLVGESLMRSANEEKLQQLTV